MRLMIDSNLLFSFSNSGSSSQATLWLFLWKTNDYNDNDNDNDHDKDKDELCGSKLLLFLLRRDWDFTGSGPSFDISIFVNITHPC